MFKRFLSLKLAPLIVAIATVAIAGPAVTAAAIQGSPAHSHHEHDGDFGYDKDQCKDGGWRNFKNPDGSPMFKNQGQCVAFFAHHDQNDGDKDNGHDHGHDDDHGHGH